VQIVTFERGEFTSIGIARGEGLAFSFVAVNESGSIEVWRERVDGVWQTVAGPAPKFLRSLVGARCADERWRHGEGPFVIELRTKP
jgi:hypothetical protein